jgi:hypothetical protein
MAATSTSTSSIDPALLPYLTTGLDAAQQRFLTGPQPQFYPGQTYVSPSAETTQALDLTKQRALAGSPMVGAAGNFLTGVINGQNVNPAMSYLSKTANGDFLNSNPYLDQMFNNAANKVTSGVQSQFAGAGRLGSGANAAALASPLSSLAANIYGTNYATERQNQLNAQNQIGNFSNTATAQRLATAGAAPAFAQSDYADIGKLANVGAANEAIAGQPLAQDMAKYNFNQQLPYQQLQGYLSSVYGTPLGSYGSQTTTYPQNGMINTLAGAGAGYLGGQALGSFLGGTPFSLSNPSGYGLAGAGLGGLFGNSIF